MGTLLSEAVPLRRAVLAAEGQGTHQSPHLDACPEEKECPWLIHPFASK